MVVPVTPSYRHDHSSHNVKQYYHQVSGNTVRVEVHNSTNCVGAGAVGQRARERAPEWRQHRGLKGPAGRGVAEDDEEKDRDADTEDPEEDLEGHGDRGGGGDDHRSEQPQRDEVASKRAQELIDDERASEPRENGVGDDGSESKDRPPGVCWA